VYDDLLNLNPGGFQGGFVPKECSAHDRILSCAMDKAPIFVYKKKPLKVSPRQKVVNRKRLII
jgi:hypothetical protein